MDVPLEGKDVEWLNYLSSEGYCVVCVCAVWPLRLPLLKSLRLVCEGVGEGGWAGGGWGE